MRADKAANQLFHSCFCVLDEASLFFPGTLGKFRSAAA